METLLEKKKLLILSNFSFPHVFEICLFLRCHYFSVLRKGFKSFIFLNRYSLWSKMSGEQEVDMIRNQTIAAISKYVKDNPKAKREDLQKEISKHIFDFAKKVESLWINSAYDILRKFIPLSINFIYFHCQPNIVENKQWLYILNTSFFNDLYVGESKGHTS